MYYCLNTNKKLLVSSQFSRTCGVTKYGSCWRKDVVNQCLEFGPQPVPYLVTCWLKENYLVIRASFSRSRPIRLKRYQCLHKWLRPFVRIFFISMLRLVEDVPLVEFYVPILVFIRMPGESYRRRLRSSLLYLCYVFRALITSLVCWFCSTILVLSTILIHKKHAFLLLFIFPVVKLELLRELQCWLALNIEE